MQQAISEDWLSARAHTTPKATALIIGKERWNYHQLDKLVEVVASNLDSASKMGDRVAGLLHNNLAYVCLVHAAARCGIILVPVNIRLTSDEISWQLERAGCTVLVYEEATADLAYSVEAGTLCLIEAADLFTTHPNQEPGKAFPLFDLERTQGIVYSSGTTGVPKGAMLSFSNHFFSAASSAFRIGLSTDDCWLCCLPLYHVGGLAILFRSCLYGTAVELHDGFDVSIISDSVDSQGITLISLVPTMLHRLIRYRADGTWPEALRLVLLGGAAASQELMHTCQARGIPLATTYGLTEAASQVATMLPDAVGGKPGSVGRPLLFTRIMIVGEDGNPLPPGETGEIVVTGPTIMESYDQDEESTARALHNGWLFTGDIGILDHDGDLWVLQRRDDVIISGGENVYPAEIEDVLQAHPLVVEACVVGVDNEEWGQRVVAAVVTAENEIVTHEELLSFCRQRLAGFKTPRQMLFLKALPKTASGKIQRRSVAELVSSLEGS